MKRRIVMMLLVITFEASMIIGCTAENKRAEVVSEEVVTVEKDTQDSVNSGDNDMNYENSTELSSQNNETFEQPDKEEWISSRLKQNAEELEKDNIIEMPFVLLINDKEYVVPFKGTELKANGVMFHYNDTILSDSVSFGDAAMYHSDNGEKTFKVGFLNETLDDKVAEDCLVDTIDSKDDSLILKATSLEGRDSPENYKGTNYIKLGTSLKETLELLNQLGCKISYTTPISGVENIEQYIEEGYTKYNKIITNNSEWKINLRFANTSKEKIESSDEININNSRSTESLKIDYFDIILIGDNDEGIKSISYDYSLVNYDEYSKRFKDMYE